MTSRTQAMLDASDLGRRAAPGPVSHAAGQLPDAMALESLTVRDALAVPAMRRGLPQVLAGHDQLDRPVRWVHAGEVSNIASLLIGGELLLTTGMGIGGRASEQRAFIAGLAAKQIAALVVELGTSFKRMPDALVAAAAEHDLPLIALNREIPFIAVTEAVHGQIVSSHYALMRRGEQVRQHLRDLILDGEGIPELLAEVAATLHAPVFLEGSGGRLLAHATPPGYDLEALELWEGAHHSLDLEASYAAPVRRGAHNGYARLVALDLPSPVDTVTKVVTDHAADIIAFALLRERQEEELLARKRALFLSDLADGRIATGLVENAAAAAGLESLGDVLLPVAADVRTIITVDAAEWAGALQEVHQQAAAAGVALIIGRREATDGVLALAALRNRDQRASVAEVIATALRSVLTQRLAAERVTVVVGHSTAGSAAASELRLAERAAASAASLEGRSWHDVSTLELRCLLWSWRGDPDLAAFVERTLAPLLEHDRRRRQALLPTLEALLAHGGHKAETARALHLNRQALYQRLARIEELLELDLSDAECLLRLHVAIQAREYFESAP